MAGSGSDKELDHWRTLATRLPGRGRRRPRAEPVLPAHGPRGHGLEHRQGPGAVLVRHPGGEGGREGARCGRSSRPPPATSRWRRARSSAAAPTPSSRRTPSRRCPLIDPETLEFEMNVDGLVSSGGLGGPAILPLSLAKMSQMTRAFPEKSFSGIGGIADFRARAQLLPARLRHGAGVHRGDARPRGRPDRDQAPASRLPRRSSRRTPTGLARPRGLPRPAPRARGAPTRRSSGPEPSDYQGGYEAQEGYARQRGGRGDEKV